MFILTVIPISRGIGVTQLSYFSAKECTPGSLVSVPVRGSTKQALVLSSTPATEEKASIKKAGYTLKKIQTKTIRTQCHPAVIRASKETADWYATTAGSILYHTLPTTVSTSDFPNVETGVHGRFTVSVLQAPDAERLAQYKSIVREAFAQKESIFITAPTQHDIEKLYTHLSKGIEPYTITLHSGLSQKNIRERIHSVHTETHSIVVIATPGFLSIPRKDISTIIVERESSRAYRTHARPYINMCTYIKKFAKHLGVRCILADTLISIETFSELSTHDHETNAPLGFRPLTSAHTTVINIEEERRGRAEQKEPWRILSNATTRLIERTHEESKNLFLFNAKRGLSPLTLCGDCTTPVTCTACENNMTLHKTGKGNIFLCHNCGEKRSAREKCSNCESWNLKTLGIGTEQIEAEIQREYPQIPVFRIDSETASTYAKGKKIYSEFIETPGSVLVGTEAGIHYITQPLPFVGIVSLDSLFAIPDFRIHERIVSLITILRTTATEEFLIQTRDPKNDAILYGMRGTLLEFLRDEQEVRKEFNYPPYSLPIRITLTGKKDSVKKTMEKTAELFSEHSPKLFPAFIQPKGKFTMHLLFFVPQEKWIDAEVVSKLQSLPQQFLVTVDPETIL